MNEFSAIEKYFRPLTEGHDDLQDDAAILAVPPGMDLVISSDTMNAGTHFMEDAAPGNIAHKVLRASISDLAAMGADPFAYQLNMAFPAAPDEEWLEKFTHALCDDQKHFKIFCSGGDTTTIKGPLSVSITAMGFVPTGKAIRRSGARAGDRLILTGPVGDALIGLRVLQGELKTAHSDYFIEKYYLPVPRLAQGELIRRYAHAAIDISDGLIADVGHICAASKCGARIDLETVPFSPKAQETSFMPLDLVTGGDDYELALAVGPGDADAVLAELTGQGLMARTIGSFTEGAGISVFQNGEQLPIPKTGWKHF